MSVNVREVEEATLFRMQDYSHPSRFVQVKVWHRRAEPEPRQPAPLDQGQA